MSFKALALSLFLMFISVRPGFAQVSAAEPETTEGILRIPEAQARDTFRPLHLRYLQYGPSGNGLRLMLDKGDGAAADPAVEQTAGDLLRYFFTGIALPDDAFWVNLRPDSPDRIMDPGLARTDAGRVLLEADLQLKKDTARLTSPATPEGAEYWEKLQRKAAQLFGADTQLIPAVARPWIVPDEIIIREGPDNAYVYKATLKVMLEQDHLREQAAGDFQDERLRQLNGYAAGLMRELIVPRLTGEVNSARRYAPLRQVYYSLILARWFKERFTGARGLYADLIGKRSLAGLASKTPWSTATYFNAYRRSFRDGEYSLKTPAGMPGGTIRSYSSGGVAMQTLAWQRIGTDEPVAAGRTYLREASAEGAPDAFRVVLQKEAPQAAPWTGSLPADAIPVDMRTVYRFVADHPEFKDAYYDGENPEYPRGCNIFSHIAGSAMEAEGIDVYALQNGRHVCLAVLGVLGDGSRKEMIIDYTADQVSGERLSPLIDTRESLGKRFPAYYARGVKVSRVADINMDNSFATYPFVLSIVMKYQERREGVKDAGAAAAPSALPAETAPGGIDFRRLGIRKARAKAVLCIADILRRQEEEACALEPGLRDMLTGLETGN